MISVPASLNSLSMLPKSATSSYPMRRMFVLIQTKPTFEIVATSNDRGRLERERDDRLAKPLDQGVDGVRELRIEAGVHFSEPSRDRRQFQRQNRFR